MLKQTFSTSDLLKLITYGDYSKYDGFGKDQEKTLEILSVISEKINSADYKISSLNKVSRGGSEIFSLSNIEDDFVLRKINDSIKKFYKVKQADRNLIVNQIIVLLQEAIPMSIIKLDIKQFYESIDRNWIINKLKEDALLSTGTMKILENFFELSEFSSFKGLPRGINISATLSELFLRDFDRQVKKIEEVYYYARYVDDIILFTTDDPELIISEINEKNILRKPLQFNNAKTKHFKVDNPDKTTQKDLSFEYLGYKFTFSDCCKKLKSEFHNKEISISIATKKVKKYKTRIIKSFLDYLKNNDFLLLEDRLKFLSGNYPIRRNPKEGTVLYAGLFYNYPYINEIAILDELTFFLRKTINSKNKSFGTKINASLTSIQKGKLSKYSFSSGWNNRKINSDFSPERVKSIKKCWHNG